MKEFQRNYLTRSTVTEKKGQKVKNHRSEETCKCFAPVVKLHRYDCPMVWRPCPVHGTFYHCGLKKKKPVTDQNMIISFHPSSKTERLFHPIKTFLGRCNSETKISFQYYPPKCCTSSETFIQQQGKGEGLKKPVNTSGFVEKTKSFVADKTNKMKKLKQCFYSPCNSISPKPKTNISVKDKFSDIFNDSKHNQKSFSFLHEKPFDDSKSLKFANLFGFKDRELNETDFITLTEKSKNNIINHKIFEIKHKKGLNDVSFIGINKPSTQLVYSSIEVSQNYSESSDETIRKAPSRKESFSDKGSRKHSVKNKQEEVSSENSQSSDGSVYFTPFVCAPAGVPTAFNENKPISHDKGVQVQDLPQETKEMIHKAIQTHEPEEPERVISMSPIESDQYLDRVESEREQSVKSYREPSVTSDIEPPVRSYRESSVRTDRILSVKEKFAVVPRAKSEVEEYHPESSVIEPPTKRSISMQDKTTQTTPHLYERESTEKRKMSRPSAYKPILTSQGTQTIAARKSTHEEFIPINSKSKVTVVDWEHHESDPAIDKLAKAWWGKSHSDSELYDNKKCDCVKGENVIPIPKALPLKSHVRASESSGGKPSDDSHRSSKKHNSIYFSDIDNETHKKKNLVNKEAGSDAPVSDLSDLIKLIEEVFTKMNVTCMKACSCEESNVKRKNFETYKEEDPFNHSYKRSKDVAIMAESGVPRKDKEVQTDYVYILETFGRSLGDSDIQNASEYFPISGKNQPSIRIICPVCSKQMTENDSKSDTSFKEKAPAKEVTEIKRPRAKSSARTSAVSTGSTKPKPMPRKTEPVYKETKTRRPTGPKPPNVKPQSQTLPSRESSDELRECLCDEVKSCEDYIQENETECCFALPKGSLSSKLPRAEYSTNRVKRESTDTESGFSFGRYTKRINPVLVETHWPSQLTWKEFENKQQKRIYEMGLEGNTFPVGKKKKSETEQPPGEYFVFGNTELFSKGSLNSQKRRKGFHWVPPTKYTFGQLKMNKSEEKMNNSNKQKINKSKGISAGTNSISIFVKPKSNSFECKKNKLFDKLYECRVCKSLTYLKPDNFDGLNIPSNGQSDQSSRKFENFLEECSHFFNQYNFLKENIPEEEVQVSEDES